MKKIIAVFLLVVFCFPAISLAKKKPPKWVAKDYWEEDGYHHFVGVSSKANTEDEGRREAYDNAVSEATQALFGISGRVDMASFADLKKVQISQDIFVSTEEVRLKATPVDVYVERFKEGNTTKYNVYRQIKIKKSEAEKELARLKDLAEKKKTIEGKVMAPSKDLIEVNVEGTALILDDNTPDAKAKALRNSLRKVCERLLQEWFYDETLTKNYAKLNGTIYEQCPAYIENYNVTSGYTEENLYKMNLTGYIKSGEIRRKLMDMGLYREKTPPPQYLPSSEPIDNEPAREEDTKEDTTDGV